MNASDRFLKIVKTFLPTPFTIAVGLTAVTFWIAVFASNNVQSIGTSIVDTLGYWENGLWNSGLMVFALQMMLMLVLGHVLALSQPVNTFISSFIKYCNTTAKAALLVTFLTILVSLFNWGLGLIFGAIFARKVGDQAQQNNIPLNYPLIGAAGYSGLMVWHGGLSGSAPIKVAEPGHFLEQTTGVISQAETVFSSMNLTISIALIIVVPLVMYFIGKQSRPEVISIRNTDNQISHDTRIEGAERLDHSKFLAIALGGIILSFALYKAVILPENLSLNFITPNFINFLLLGLGILFHGNFHRFLLAVDEAIGGASGILIQFPLYFGIMGIMKDSGLVNQLSSFFVSISNETTFPIFTFFSAGLVNIFVPSGGGQWAVQGPIIVDAAQQLNVSIPKSIMALAYGDQITNMLQPFWALPLLGITGLKAKEILPYTLLLLVVGSIIFILGLLLF